MKSLLRLFRKREPDHSQGYRVYTHDYDKIIDAKDLDSVLGPLSDAAKASAWESWDLLGQGLQVWRTSADLAALNAGARVRGTVAGLADTAIAVLVDHSGSMKGRRILLAAAATEISYDFLTSLGCVVEVLGFTTVSWKGGRSRKRWLGRGRWPRAPGRLCDLLHVVYRRAGDPAASLAPMLRPGLLKENVDGEALAWAASRLRALPQRRKILLVVSDGAPVDDSTLLANDLGYLDRNLCETIADLEAASDIELAAMGVDYDVSRYYPRAAVVQTPDDLGLEMISLLESLLTSAPTSPNVSD
ncbi:cobalamin biosynthesis protein CobT [Caulobacter sp.]|jgi:cobaltochelatase CobT|uniref:cobaltochelatase CobT-related protein n=1 Tax=Caulobacter sp. TaxID=78 RepID=UPI001617B981